MNDPFLPVLSRIAARQDDSGDVFSLTVESPPGYGQFAPGQFNMLYVPGAGEAAISISGDPAETDQVAHTIRSVGSVTRLLQDKTAGDQIGIRGPFGTGWPVADARGGDLVIIAGGIGIAPLRPVLYQVLAERDAYRNVALLYGARSPDDILFEPQIWGWHQAGLINLFVSVDTGSEEWKGDVGVVTEFIQRATFEADRAVAMICGPEIMIRFSVNKLRELGMSRERIYVSLERNMKCAIGFCGHCQLGPHFICRNGPVFSYDTVESYLTVQGF